ncbi:filamin A-interacting protein 1-like [Osmerus mordax]|uniref:filamin A-interacting protein 1-like n=1 Tax=Osmerus mordax TaxID=8014 RepID=UPI00350F96AB
MTAKLANEDAQNQQLRQRLAMLGRQVDELERTRGDLRRAEEELRELRDRVAGGRGEDGGETASPVLLSEVEQLRRRVVEMEGKDGDGVRLVDQCGDLDRRLGHASIQGRSLKAEVEKLNGRISELDRLEEALGRSRQEGSSLRSSLEKEKAATKQLSGELEVLRIRVRELEAIEGPLERSEGRLRQDLTKLRTLTMVLVEDRKAMAERLQQAEHKLQQGKEGRSQEGHNKVSPADEKLVEERGKALKSRAEMEERYRSVERERDELGSRLRTEEERSRDLQSKANSMRRRIEALERRDGGKERREGKDDETNDERKHEDDDNKVLELSQEVERLRRRLTQKEVVEEELMKAEEEYESLERRCNEEQERSRALREKLEEARTEVSRYRLAEKGKEEPNQEHLLLIRLQEEQVKSRLLSREVETLREKVQRLMGTEESIGQVQMDHATLQRRLAQQEVRNRELAREMEGLTQELERYRHFSKSLRPGMNGRRFADLHQSTKEVQTEPEKPNHLPPDYQSLAPTVLNGKLLGDDGKDLNHNEKQVVKKNSSPLANLNMQNNNLRRSSIPLANRKVSPQGNSEVLNSNLVKKGDLVVTHNPGQPLHIKVTPDHSLNTATLEISSPTADNTTSYTSTALIPTTGAPPKQRITIIQNSSMSPPKVVPCSPSAPDEVSSPSRAFSPPLTLTSLSRVATPNSLRSHTPDPSVSPVQILTVCTGSSDPTEVVGQAMFRVTPERQPNGWHLQKSTSAGPSVITTDDNKIHIHLGSPYIQALNGIAHVATQPGRQYHSPGQEPGGARTQVLPNGCHVKSSGKITSSITITPATSPASHPSHITVSGLYE